MKAQIIMDNTAAEGLLCEWGFSVYIEYNGQKFLLDTGASGQFIDNAKSLGIDISDVDFGILSHAHYDHSDGLAAFFENNAKAKFYLREGSKENCFRGAEGERYIGIHEGFLNEFEDRIVYASGDVKLAEGVYLVPHKTDNLEAIGRKADMYVKCGDCFKPDDFSHEQSLVFETEKGLVIFSSCSHGGADNIIKEIELTFPGKQIYALIGGLHLFESADEDVYALADRVKATGITKIITGHCTGAPQIEMLKDRLGSIVEETFAGLVFEA